MLFVGRLLPFIVGHYEADAVYKYQLLLLINLPFNDKLSDFIKVHRWPEGQPTIYSSTL